MLSELKDKSRNDIFRKIDQKELLGYLKKEKLEFRDKLYIDDSITFGLEIECEKISKKKLQRYVSENDLNWLIKDDDSLENGVEINSPILSDNSNSWHELKIICDYLKRKKVEVFKNAGGHIHIGVNAIGDNPNNWLTFLKVYCLYEDVIYKFCYGDKAKPRKYLRNYAKPISDVLNTRISLLNDNPNVREIINVLPSFEKYYGINSQNIMIDNLCDSVQKNTLEFRFPNSSTKCITWQNNVNLLVKLITCFKNEYLDSELIDFCLKKKLYYSFSDYSKVNFNKAVLFADSVFDNNMDKVYFLKQYIK